MPKVKTKRTVFPDGWEIIEPTLQELDAKMRDAEAESHEGKRKVESSWPIFRIHHQRTRYIYEMYKKHTISKELYEYCLREGYADGNLIAKWKKPGYDRLCCLRCVQTRDTNFGTTCICRVPKADLEPGKIVQCQHCGCRGCASGDGVAPLLDLRSGTVVAKADARAARPPHADHARERQREMASVEKPADDTTSGLQPTNMPSFVGMPFPFSMPMPGPGGAMTLPFPPFMGAPASGDGSAPEAAPPAFPFPFPMPFPMMPGMPGMPPMPMSMPMPMPGMVPGQLPFPFPFPFPGAPGGMTAPPEQATGDASEEGETGGVAEGGSAEEQEGGAAVEPSEDAGEPEVPQAQ